MALSIPFTLYNHTDGPRYTKLNAHSHLNPIRTGSCYNNQLVDLEEASWPTGNKGCGLRGNIRKKNSRKNSHKLAWFTQVSSTLTRTRKNKCPLAYLTSYSSSDVKSTLIYSRTRSSSNHTQSQDTNRSTPLAGLPSTSASVYSRRRCSKAFRALPTIEEGIILYYTEM